MQWHTELWSTSCNMETPLSGQPLLSSFKPAIMTALSEQTSTIQFLSHFKDTAACKFELQSVSLPTPQLAGEACTISPEMSLFCICIILYIIYVIIFLLLFYVITTSLLASPVLVLCPGCACLPPYNGSYTVDGWSLAVRACRICTSHCHNKTMHSLYHCCAARTYTAASHIRTQD